MRAEVAECRGKPPRRPLPCNCLRPGRSPAGMAMVSIVMNADDFGLSDGICRSIMELFEADAISSTSLMTAAPGAKARLENWRVSQLKDRAGVHLQLTAGQPLSPLGEVQSLID